MDAIFGRQKEPKLFSLKNDLLISKHIEVVFDSGKLVKMPDLPDRADIKLLSWLRSERREYKVKVIDHTWAVELKSIGMLYGQAKSWYNVVRQ